MESSKIIVAGVRAGRGEGEGVGGGTHVLHALAVNPLYNASPNGRNTVPTGGMTVPIANSLRCIRQRKVAGSR